MYSAIPGKVIIWQGFSLHQKFCRHDQVSGACEEVKIKSVYQIKLNHGKYIPHGASIPFATKEVKNELQRGPYNDSQPLRRKSCRHSKIPPRVPGRVCIVLYVYFMVEKWNSHVQWGFAKKTSVEFRIFLHPHTMGI